MLLADLRSCILLGHRDDDPLLHLHRSAELAVDASVQTRNLLGVAAFWPVLLHCTDRTYGLNTNLCEANQRDRQIILENICEVLLAATGQPLPPLRILIAAHRNALAQFAGKSRQRISQDHLQGLG